MDPPPEEQGHLPPAACRADRPETLSAMRVLIVEDNAKLAAFISEVLHHAGYGVNVASDGNAAMEMGARPGFDLILLDVRLPGHDGITVCRRLRARGVRIPILMLTGMDSVEDRVRGLEAGADDYLGKPFAMEELLARVRALLRRPPVLQDIGTLTVGDLTLDCRTREVRRGKERIELTPREFSLLEFLMRRADRVSPRPVIEEQVWGYQHDPLTNVVDVYIRRLRRKIDEGHAHPLIRTVRGVGYRIRK